MTVDEMMGRMSAREFTEWQVLDTIDPIGSVRGDMQAARVAQTVAEVHRDRKAKRTPFKLLDFMPDPWHAFRPKRTAADIERDLRAAFGG